MFENFQTEVDQNKRGQTPLVAEKTLATSTDDRDDYNRHNKKPVLEKNRDSFVENSRFPGKVAATSYRDYPTPGGTSTSSGDLGYATGPSELNYPGNYSQNSTPASNYDYYYGNFHHHHHQQSHHHPSTNQTNNFIGNLPPGVPPPQQPGLINQPNAGVWWPNTTAPDGRPAVYPPNTAWPPPGTMPPDSSMVVIPGVAIRGAPVSANEQPAMNVKAAMAVSKKKDSSFNASPAGSDTPAIHTPTKDSRRDSPIETRKTLDLDTRIAMLLKDKAGGMAPPFLQFGSDSEDERKDGADEEMLSNPPSPFLTCEMYESCFQKAQQRNRERRRVRQNSLNQIPKAKVDDDLGSLISSSEDEALLGSYSPTGAVTKNNDTNEPEPPKDPPPPPPPDDDRMSLSPLSSGDEKIEEVCISF